MSYRWMMPIRKKALSPEIEAIARSLERSTKGAFNTADLVSVYEMESEVPFRQTAPALTEIDIQQYAPFDGYITALTFFFPNGCFDPVTNLPLVQVCFRCVHGRFPMTGYVALNNTTRTYSSLKIPVDRYEQLIVTVINGDGINSHTPSVQAVIRRTG